MSGSMNRFTFAIPTDIEYGPDSFTSLGTVARRLGSKALLVTTAGESLRGRQEEGRRLLEQEGVEVVLFAEVYTNPDTELIDRGSALARNENCDLIIGLGGGSALDVAKAIAVTAVENAGIWEIVEGRDIGHKPLPLIAVPTTSGTGSEVTRYSVISHRQKKMKEGIGRREFYPVISIVDPLLTLSMPAALTAAVGLDTLTHAVEAYTTVFASPLTDILAESAIRLVGTSLRRAVYYPRDIEARSDMMMASMLAGMAITHADTSLAHVVGEAVGAVFNVHHGLAVSLTLPAVMEYNCYASIEKFSRIAELLGENTTGSPTREAAGRAPGAVRKLIYDTDVPLGLGALGVTHDSRILDLCTRPGSDEANPRPAARGDFEAILSGSLSEEMSFWKIVGTRREGSR